MKLWKRLITFWIVQKYQYNSSGYPKFLWIFLYFRKESINKMKLGKHKKLKKKVNSKKQLVAYDCETSYDNSLLPTVTVSFSNITLNSNTTEKSTKAIILPSSRTQTTAPCDRCHRKAKQLFSVGQHGSIYFVCHTCYKEVCANPSKATKSIVDLGTSLINSQSKIEGRQLKTQLNKRKQTRKKK